MSTTTKTLAGFRAYVGPNRLLLLGAMTPRAVERLDLLAFAEPDSCGWVVDDDGTVYFNTGIKLAAHCEVDAVMPHDDWAPMPFARPVERDEPMSMVTGAGDARREWHRVEPRDDETVAFECNDYRAWCTPEGAGAVDRWGRVAPLPLVLLDAMRMLDAGLSVAATMKNPAASHVETHPDCQLVRIVADDGSWMTLWGVHEHVVRAEAWRLAVAPGAEFGQRLDGGSSPLERFLVVLDTDGLDTMDAIKAAASSALRENRRTFIVNVLHGLSSAFADFNDFASRDIIDRAIRGVE